MEERFSFEFIYDSLQKKESAEMKKRISWNLSDEKDVISRDKKSPDQTFGKGKGERTGCIL